MWNRTAVDALCSELAVFSGYRSLFLDPGGHLCHAEPDEELEQVGYHHVATVFRPSPELLLGLLARVRHLDLGADLPVDAIAQPSPSTAALTAS